MATEDNNSGRGESPSWVSRFFAALSTWWLAVLAVGMGMAPWPAGPMPHLIEKTLMLARGTLHRPIDIFDLFVHALPLTLLVAKLLWMRTKNWKQRSRGDSHD